MRNSLKNAEQIHENGGAIASSDWITGSGRFIKQRPIPVFCELIELYPAHHLSDGYRVDDKYYQLLPDGRWGDEVELKGFAAGGVSKLLKRRPRVRRLVVMTDVRGFRRAMKKEGAK